MPAQPFIRCLRLRAALFAAACAAVAAPAGPSSAEPPAGAPPEPVAQYGAAQGSGTPDRDGGAAVEPAPRERGRPVAVLSVRLLQVQGGPQDRARQPARRRDRQVNPFSPDSLRRFFED